MTASSKNFVVSVGLKPLFKYNLIYFIFSLLFNLYFMNSYSSMPPSSLSLTY